MSPAFVRSWMWAEALEVVARAERLQRQFFHPHEAPVRHPSWEPPIDLFDTRDGIVLLVALPGVREDQLELRAGDDGLIIIGDRPVPEAVHDAVRIRRMEIPYGRFERRVALPPGRFVLAERTLRDGCLLVSLHRSEG